MLKTAERPTQSEPPPVLFDETQKQRLAELYAPCYALALQLRESGEFGDADLLRRRVKQLLDLSERDAARLGFMPQDVQSASFALVALLDETILSSEWSEKDRWIARPLQLERYNRYDAGEEFFVRLDGLQSQPTLHADVLEVYYLCVALGFKGKYLLYDQERLRQVVEDAHSQLCKVPGMKVGPLSPHGRPRGQAASEVRSKLPLWVILAFVLFVALGAWFTAQVLVEHHADRVAAAIEAEPRTTLTP